MKRSSACKPAHDPAVIVARYLQSRAVHRTLHIIGMFMVLGAWYVNRFAHETILCESFPQLTAFILVHSNELLALEFIPVGGFLALSLSQTLSARAHVIYLSWEAIALWLFSSSLVAYIGLSSIFDCGWGIPLEVK